MFNNKLFSSFLKLCSVLPALAIMPAMAEDIVAKIGNEPYGSLNDAIDAVTSGQTIVMQQDVPDGTGKSVARNGDSFTIDLGGTTFSAYEHSVGSSGTEYQLFQLLAGDGLITFQNGTLDVAAPTDKSGKFKMLIQNYGNLKFDNMVLDGRNLIEIDSKVPYTFSNNQGNIELVNTKVYSNADGVAFDAYYWATHGYTKGTHITLEDSSVYGNIETGGNGDFKGSQASLTFNGNNTVVGNIDNDGTVKVNGDLVLDGIITGEGFVEFDSNSTLKANLDGSTIVSAKTVTGTTSLVLDNGSDGKTFKIKGTTTNSLTFADNALFGITSTGETEKTWTITKKSVAQQTANLEKAGLDSTAAKTVAAISGVKTMGNEQVDALFTELTIAAQAGDADAIAQINEVAKAINPESESVVQSAAVSTQNTINNLTAGRMALGHNGGDVDLTAGGVWVQGLYNKSKNADKFSANTRGISAGIDGTINNDIMVGIGYAFGRSDVNAQTRDTDIDSHSVFLYGQYKPSAWYANATLNYTTSKYEESGISIVPVDSEYRANTFGANVATGYDFASGITPELGLRYMHVRTNAYTNSLGMNVDANSTDFLTGIVGARYGFDIMASDAFLIRPELSAAAKYDMLSDKNVATVALPGVNAYTLDGERLNRFGGEFGAGLTMSYYGFDLSLTYSIDVRKDYTSQTGMAKFRYNF